jgi:hypothetical protein
MKTLARTVWLLPALLLLAGCVSNQTASKAPSADLSKLKSFHVVKLEKDERGINDLITAQLTEMGFTASTGSAPAPSSVDALVTYQDKWMWDMTMYMIQLDIQFRDPSSNAVLASGSSQRSSLKRKSPASMVEEVLTRILAQ